MLAQSEIDALLSGAIEMDQQNGGDRVNLAGMMNQPGEHSKGDGEDSKSIQTYNFWSPARFSKEQMRAVELVHEDLCERLTTSLPTFLTDQCAPAPDPC